MKLIVDLRTQKITAFLKEYNEVPAPIGSLLIECPESFDINFMQEYYYVEGQVVQDHARWVGEFTAQRILEIKKEAQDILVLSDWELQRAQEREEGGWATLSEVNKILAKREAIRRSSDAAEVAVLALTDPNEIVAFTWSVTYDVPVPRRVTRQAFMSLFNQEETGAIFTAAKESALIEGWLMRVQAAQYVNLDDPSTILGVQGMVAGGLLTEARAAEILSAQ